MCGPACQALHSYAANGVRVCWRPPLPGRYAVDAELAGQPVPDALAARWASEGHPDGAGFWEAWTATEVAAKLTGTSILTWLRRHPLGALPAGVEAVHRTARGLLMCFGRHAGTAECGRGPVGRRVSW